MYKKKTHLSHAALEILVVLAAGHAHGYEIMKTINEQPDARLQLGPGGLYGTIKALLEQGYIAEGESDERRRYYRITAPGKKALEHELAYYEALIERARPAQDVRRHAW